jgi:hypothetical protein
MTVESRQILLCGAKTCLARRLLREPAQKPSLKAKEPTKEAPWTSP